MPTLEYIERARRENYFANPPENPHRYNEGNRPAWVVDDYVEFCPNGDGTTRLPSGSIVVVVSHCKGEEPIYREYTSCPDCGCQVIQKPTPEKIEEFLRRNAERNIFTKFSDSELLY